MQVYFRNWKTFIFKILRTLVPKKYSAQYYWYTITIHLITSGDQFIFVIPKPGDHIKAFIYYQKSKCLILIVTFLTYYGVNQNREDHKCVTFFKYEGSILTHEYGGKDGEINQKALEKTQNLACWGSMLKAQLLLGHVFRIEIDKGWQHRLNFSENVFALDYSPLIFKQTDRFHLIQHLFLKFRPYLERKRHIHFHILRISTVYNFIVWIIVIILH